MHNLDATDLIAFATAWSSLGDGVTHQVELILDDEHADVNPGAIRLASDRLQGMNQEIDDAIELYLWSFRGVCE